MRQWEWMSKQHRKEDYKMTKKDLEQKVEELTGLVEIYKDGISKKELKMFALKWTVVGFVVGALVGSTWL